MATQGIVSIVRDGKTAIKIIAGCNGQTAGKLAAAIRKKPPTDGAQAHKLAIKHDFGCNDCLVVQVDNGNIISEIEHDELGPLYHDADKFKDPRFNPRWDLGTAAYTKVIEL